MPNPNGFDLWEKMSSVISILWFILILSVIVISHEMGHFLVARSRGIRVREFDVGMGPIILSFTKGETKYALRALPLGGACIFDGDETLPSDNKENAGDEETDDPHCFKNASVGSRIATVFAGPLFNFILGFIFSIIIVASCGEDIPVVSGLTEGRPAYDSGLSVGDTITKINGEHIHLWRDITLISYLNAGEELDIEFLHNGQKMKTTIVPVYVEGDNRYYIGIEGGSSFIRCKGLSVFKYSIYEMSFNFKNTLKALRQLIFGKLSRDSVSGPVGIASAVSSTYDEVKDDGFKYVLLTMINIALLLTVNLGIVNLLPIPALDGGRLIFLFIELVRGKPVPAEKEGLVHLIGIILLLLLTVFVFINDILRIFGI